MLVEVVLTVVIVAFEVEVTVEDFVGTEVDEDSGGDVEVELVLGVSEVIVAVGVAVEVETGDIVLQ